MTGKLTRGEEIKDGVENKGDQGQSREGSVKTVLTKMVAFQGAAIFVRRKYRMFHFK